MLGHICADMAACSGAQRESFDVIGKVGFGKDFQASRDIDNSVNNTFRLLSNDFEEAMRRMVFPLRRYSRSAVSCCNPVIQKQSPCLAHIALHIALRFCQAALYRQASVLMACLATLFAVAITLVAAIQPQYQWQDIRLSISIRWGWPLSEHMPLPGYGSTPL